MKDREYKISSGLITGEIHDQPLVDVITEIGELAGFSVIVIDETTRFPSVNTYFDKLFTLYRKLKIVISASFPKYG